MNCFSGLTILVCMFACAACGAPASENTASSDALEYSVHYTVKPVGTRGSVDVTMQVKQERHLLREVSFAIRDDLIAGVSANSGLEFNGSRVTWRPSAKGGEIKWRAHPTQRRGGKGYDALLNQEFGIFRAEDIIPRARTRTLRGATARTTMQLDPPRGWTAISEYSSVSSPVEIENEERRFAQPTGWIAVGELGIRRDTIAGTRVAVAAPEGQSVRRMDMLALLNWTLPELANVAPDPLPRLTIISAGDPMWRGGLSAPRSVFIHADRPLISENATSTLLHEVVHVAFDIDAANGHDWIQEGLAEYYSLELLQRGAAITTRRYKRAMQDQQDWSKDAGKLCGKDSSGPTTALAVMRFRALDSELREKSGGTASLDTLIGLLAESKHKVTTAILISMSESLVDGPVEAIEIGRLPGCKDFAGDIEG